MYNVNNFCNIIAALRKERGWSQNMLAEKLDISPQSVSKWECGVGLPNVTLFPVIAEVMQVPIEVLFGERPSDGNRTECHFSHYSESDSIQVYLGNICRVEFVEDENVHCSVLVYGDGVFLNYFDVEQDENTLRVNVKNPSGSEDCWEKYDRKGYKGENYVRICTGRKKDETDIQVINYLDLKATAKENQEGNYEVECDKETENEIFALCESVERSGKPDMQCGARRFEALMYVMKEEYDRAEELINALPSYLCGRELLIAEVYTGEKKRQCYENIINMLEAKVEYYKSRVDCL